ncbi:MAG: DUF1294 domain-containing protein [Oscillospiraceae bacterium]|jgi:uncharacterized membrane protein YsdA (DUF1294 family)|nr:DUF1294 domain-containing protein [Oscillospiraceae bacterium]MCI1991434.1 DUF1294 domain-containing protein [Oscillospiraceae bacterium]MCI2035848.1 DUF1294 domain-containing protein [Oscillospiraceae bacterium]
MPTYIYGACFLFIINLASALVTVSDKRRARRHLWRVPEHTLLALAFLGGAPAMLFTMLLIRHKTRHLKFMAGLPLIIFLQILALAFFIRGGR